MLSGLTWTEVTALAAAAVLLDLALGEVRRWHPLVGFGRMAGAIERALNRGTNKFLRGALAWLLAVAPPVLLAYCLIVLSAKAGLVATAVLHAVLLYFCLGLRGADRARADAKRFACRA